MALSYDSGAGNSPFGLGWSLSVPAIARKTDKGVPQYRDEEDSDTFILIPEPRSWFPVLVRVIHDRVPDGSPIPKAVSGVARSVRAGTAALLAVLLPACDPGRIETFTVSPNPACRGQVVYINFGANPGDPLLEANPPVAGDLSMVPGIPFGVKRFTAELDTDITFTASGAGGDDQRTIRLRVKDAAEPLVLAPSGVCPGPSWVARVFADQWPATAEVVRVTNLESVAVRVSHVAGSFPATPTDLGPGEFTAAFSGHDLAGDWPLIPLVTRATHTCPPNCGTISNPCPMLPPVRVEIVWRCRPEPDS